MIKIVHGKELHQRFCKCGCGKAMWIAKESKQEYFADSCRPEFKWGGAEKTAWSREGLLRGRPPVELPDGKVVAATLAEAIGASSWSINSWAKRKIIPYSVVGRVRVYSIEAVRRALELRAQRTPMIRGNKVFGA